MQPAPPAQEAPRDIALALLAHTNAGKTSLARTLLGRDIGTVRDEPHVTDEAERHVLVESAEGDRLLLWDTPGFGDSMRLMRRLALADNPLGWLLREVWDRFRDRPLWCNQQAVRAARDEADVLLYLVNAAENPRDAAYVAPEMQVLRWIGKPVIVLLNQTGPPRPAAEEREELDRWRDHLAGLGHRVEVLALDAFARVWVQERVLLDTVGDLLPVRNGPAWIRLLAAWDRRNRERFEHAMHLMARHTLAAARDVAPIPPSAPSGGIKGLWQRTGLGSKAVDDPARTLAMQDLSRRLDAGVRDLTDKLLVLHGVSGSATQTVLDRLQTHFSLPKRIDETRSALWGGALAGVLAGLKADLASGGLTLGAGMLLGGVLGSLGAAGAARGLNKLSGADTPVLRWADSLLDALVQAHVLRYLAVAHFGRGRGQWREAEAPSFWRDLVEQASASRLVQLRSVWTDVRRSDADTVAQDDRRQVDRLQQVYADITRDVLAALYPPSASMVSRRTAAGASNQGAT
jgi:hypothetical protein